MKKIIIIISFIVSLFTIEVSLAEEVSCRKHKIYCQIVRNSPKINKDYAMKLSNIIYKYVKKYNLPRNIFTAILAQESMYNLKAKSCTKGIVETDCNILPLESLKLRCQKSPEKFHIIDEVCTDYGIGQVYYKTAKAYNFSIDRLTQDLDYSVKCAAIVLRDFKRMYERKELDYWTRYNASSKTKRETYKRLVRKYLQ